MRVIDVIESKRWHHKPTGRMVSIYGACPWFGDAEKVEWEMINVGWTWRCDDGTVGLCRVPAKTKEEAIEVMNRFNNRK